MKSIVNLISELSIKLLYTLPMLFYGVMVGVIIVSGIFHFTSDTVNSLNIFMLIILLSIPYLVFYTFIIRAALMYIIHVKTDVNKWLAYYRYTFEKRKNAGCLLNFQLSSLVASYYKGTFQNSIDVSEKISLSQVRKSSGIKDEIGTELVLNFTLVKVSAMLKNEAMFEKYYSNLYDQRVKTDAQNDSRANLLIFCQAIKKICLEQTPVDTHDNWQPEFLSNLLSLEKTYFQALNEQLKGNDTKAASLFKALSQENPDLFFVREAKQYLEEKK